MKRNTIIATIASLSLSLLANPVTAETPKPLSIIDSYIITINNNDQLRANRYRTQAEQERLTQAWSGIKPNVRIAGIYGYGEYSTQFQNDQTDSFHRGTIQVVQPLYSANAFRTISREQTNQQSLELQYTQDQQTIALQSTESYIQLALSIRKAEIADKQLNDHNLKYKRLEAMIERGLATRMDLLETKSRLDETQALVTTSQNEVTINKKKLERLLGEPFSSIMPINENLWRRAERLTQFETTWLEHGQNQALGVQVARANLELAKKDLKINGAGHHPEINLRAEYIKSNSYENTFLDNKKIQIEFGMPLYEGGATQSRIRAANNLVSSQQHSLRDEERNTRVQIEEVLTRLEASTANIAALEQSVKSNQAYLDAAERGLSIGVRGLFEVLEARTRIYATERRMLDEIYANIYAQFELLYLVGKFDQHSLAEYLNLGFSIESFKH